MSNATATTVDPSFLVSALEALRSLVLGASVRFCEVLITRTSLLGFDVLGLLHGADAGEVAQLLATLRGRVQGALAGAAAHLRRNYMLASVGTFKVAYGMSRSAGKPVARITFVPSAALSTKEHTDIIATAILYLREAVLAASRVGELEIRVMAL
jgi:hypothetical protein